MLTVVVLQVLVLCALWLMVFLRICLEFVSVSWCCISLLFVTCCDWCLRLWLGLQAACWVYLILLLCCFDWLFIVLRLDW